MTMRTTLGGTLRALWHARSGVAYIEFAYTFPVVLAMGTYGIEATNLAMAHTQISQVAMSLADNTSRIGQDSALSTTQFREADVNDSFGASVLQAGRFKIATRGRIILSSLEQNASGGQWIHWQRCTGALAISSSYGVQGTGKTGTAFLGMGPTGNRIQAPANNAVMFVEVFYNYEPVISTSLFGTPQLHYTAAFVVRDERDLTGPKEGSDYVGIYNPAPAAAKKTC